jgi:hypothetical protein
MVKRDRFLLEQYIMKCWHVTDDIETVLSYVESMKISPTEMDTLMNMLIGMKTLYNQKFSDTLDLYEELIRTGVVKNFPEHERFSL